MYAWRRFYLEYCIVCLSVNVQHDPTPQFVTVTCKCEEVVVGPETEIAFW